MKKPNKIFIFSALLISIFLAVFLSPFASSNPDGLEKVLENNSFIELSDGVAVYEASPAPDYVVPGIKNEKVATGLAGFAGTAIMFIVGFVFAKLLAVKNKKIT